MNTEEKNLFFSLCRFKKNTIDEALLEYASPGVLGQLFYNRMAAIAYGILEGKKLLHKVNREFRNSIKMCYQTSVEKNKNYFSCLKYLDEILSESNVKYAMLKGAVLCNEYPEGFRTANDVDILVEPKDVTLIGNILSKNGFKQGYIRNDIFEPATRQEIIQSKLMRGETVPYIKNIDLRGMPYLEVDINFSLDYKNTNDNNISIMLSDTVQKNFSGLSLMTLDDRDFFIHLCTHLYKEAMTIEWVKMKRDMSLYKYCDMYMIIDDMSHDQFSQILERATLFGLEKICAWAVLQTCHLFDLKDSYLVEKSKDILKNDPGFLHRVISPSDKKIYIYEEEDICKRFFMSDRIHNLKEYPNNEKK